MDEEIKDKDQGQEGQEEEIQIDEEIYNTIKTEIEATFNEKMTAKEQEIADLKNKLQVSNRKRTIVISNKVKEVDKPQEKPKPIDIFK